VEVKMRHKQIAFFAVLVFSLAISGAALAHHGGAAYDRTKTVSVTGTVTNYQLANPHSTISFDVKGENGKIQHWSAEFGYLRDLLAKGWRLDTLKPGDQVTVTLYPLKNGSPVGDLQKITYADGRPLNLKPGGNE
jgi:hypothetical protein